MVQALETCPHGQGLIHPAQSISWLLMPWRHKEPGHQQPWWWPSLLFWRWCRHLKPVLMDKDSSILHSQYHGCWCPGDISRQGMRNHGSGLVCYYSLSNRTGRVEKFTRNCFHMLKLVKTSGNIFPLSSSVQLVCAYLHQAAHRAYLVASASRPWEEGTVHSLGKHNVDGLVSHAS